MASEVKNLSVAVKEIVDDMKKVFNDSVVPEIVSAEYKQLNSCII